MRRSRWYPLALVALFALAIVVCRLVPALLSPSPAPRPALDDRIDRALERALDRLDRP